MIKDNVNGEILDGFEPLKITLTKIPYDPFKEFWNWYKVIWTTTNAIKYDENNEEIKKICKDILNFKTLPTPMEILQIIFNIEGLSKVGLARITRSRIGWTFNSSSGAPLQLKQQYVLPKNIRDTKYGTEVVKALDHIQYLYNKLYNEGIPPQDIRYIAPMGQIGTLNCATNYLALRNFYSRRNCSSLEDELSQICRLLKREINRKIESKEIHSNWTYLMPYLDAMCYGRVCKNFDKVFGNCGRCPGGLPAKDADFDFKKSWGYKELLTMTDDLLNPGERKMIDGWLEEEKNNDTGDDA